MTPGNPTTGDLIAELRAMGLLDLVEGICRDHGASVESVLSKSLSRHVQRARREVVFALRSIVDDVTARHRYTFVALGIMLGRDPKSLKDMLQARANDVIAFAKKHRTESSIASEKIATRGRKIVKAPRVTRAVAAPPEVEVHVWILAGVEQLEPVDLDHPVLADAGGNLIAIGRVYKGRTYAGRRAANEPAAIPDAPASGQHSRSEAA